MTWRTMSLGQRCPAYRTFFFFRLFTSHKGLEKERKARGEILWLGEENVAGKWSVWYTEGGPCWRLSETGLSWADTGLITLGQVMIWCFETKIKPKNQLFDHCRRARASCSIQIYNRVHVWVVARCHVAVAPLLTVTLAVGSGPRRRHTRRQKQLICMAW